jgi:hypothetical protein
MVFLRSHRGHEELGVTKKIAIINRKLVPFDKLRSGSERSRTDSKLPEILPKALKEGI